MQTREAEVFKLLCRGLNRDTIVLYARQEGWTETEPEIADLIEGAFAELARQAAAVDIEAEFGRAIVRLNDLYMDARKVQDTRTALNVQREINKLLELQTRRADGAAGRTRNTGRTTTRQKLRIVT